MLVKNGRGLHETLGICVNKTRKRERQRTRKDSFAQAFVAASAFGLEESGGGHQQ